jgi:Spy/CpxP family protein refolding chaperone
MKKSALFLSIVTVFASATICLAEDAPPSARALNPIEAQLFPPDFLFAQRETLGLSEAQLQDLQALVQDVQPKFEALKGQMEERSKAVVEAIQQPKPDVAKVQEKLRAMLTQENEMKVLQIGLMLNLRNKLTSEQLAKALELRPRGFAQNTNPAEGLAERLQAKFQKLRAAVEARAAGGEPPVELVEKARAIQQLVQNNKPLEAEQQLDALLATLPEGKAKP